MSISARPKGYANWPREEQDAYYRANVVGAHRALVRIPFSQFGSGSDRPWREPRPLPDGLIPVPAFQPDYLPEAFGPGRRTSLTRMQCPLDFIGATALVALGAAIGRRIAIRPQRSTDWTEVPNLWGVIIGRPGAMKSPAMQEALKPLSRIEATARADNEQALKDFEAAKELHQLKLADIRERTRKQLKDGASISRIDIDLEPTPPARRRLIVNDTEL